MSKYAENPKMTPRDRIKSQHLSNIFISHLLFMGNEGAVINKN